jgi:hypothetical protein
VARGQKLVWLACLLPAILGTLAVATAPITLPGKFASAAGIWFAYIAIAGFVSAFGTDWDDA